MDQRISGTGGPAATDQSDQNDRSIQTDNSPQLITPAFFQQALHSVHGPGIPSDELATRQFLLERTCSLCNAELGPQAFKGVCGHSYHELCFDLSLASGAICSATGCGQKLARPAAASLATLTTTTAVATAPSVRTHGPAADRVRQQQSLTEMNPREQSVHQHVSDMLRGIGQSHASAAAPTILSIHENPHYNNQLQAASCLFSIEHDPSTPKPGPQSTMDCYGIENVWGQLRDSAQNPKLGQPFQLAFEYNQCAQALADNIRQLRPKQGLYFLFEQPASVTSTRSLDDCSKMVRVYRYPDSQLGLMITRTAEEATDGHHLIKMTSHSSTDMAAYLMFMATLSGASRTLILCNSNKSLSQQNLERWQHQCRVTDALPLGRVEEQEVRHVRKAMATTLGLEAIDFDSPLPELVTTLTVPQDPATMLKGSYDEADISSFSFLNALVSCHNYIPDPNGRTDVKTLRNASEAATAAERAIGCQIGRQEVATRICDMIQNPKYPLVHFRSYIKYETEGATRSLESLYLVHDGKDYYLVSPDDRGLPVFKTDDLEAMKAYITFVLHGDLSERVIIEPFLQTD